MSRLHTCDRCGHYDWAHDKNGCQAVAKDGLKCSCPDTFSNGKLTRVDTPAQEVFRETER